MVLIKWKNPFRGGVRGCSERCRNLVTLTRLQICLIISRMTFVICCLTYNDHLNCNYVIDFLLEPIHRFVDNFAKYLGKMFVLCVVVLTIAVVLTAYWVGFPYWWERNPHVTVCLVIYGNWLLLNIIFHYYMGVTTHPGYPPKNLHLTEASSVCKKCITLKPSRTHHCSVCDRCILAMDHHCPWLNNCVGHYNVRYFYLYMVYMVAGVVFIIIAGMELGYQVMWVNDTGGLLPNNDPDLIGHPVRIDQSGSLIPVKEFDEYDAFNAPREYDLPVPPITEAQRICAHSWKRRAVFFMAFTCVGVAISLTTLLIIHGKHISKGETSVESAVNARSRAIVKSFKHPYNFGRVMNWKLFLGLTQGRGFVRHVLFPSRHRPMSNGVFWHTVVDYNEGWP